MEPCGDEGDEEPSGPRPMLADAEYERLKRRILDAGPVPLRERQLFPRELEGRFIDRWDLSREAEVRADHETLAVLERIQEAEREETAQYLGEIEEVIKQLPPEWNLSDPLSLPEVERQRFQRRVSLRPYRRPLQKRQGQQRCRKCGRWAYRCRCPGGSAQIIKDGERRLLDEMQFEEEQQAANEGSTQSKLSDGEREESRRLEDDEIVMPPYTEENLPRRGTDDYLLTLIFLFDSVNPKEEQAKWNLPDEIWQRLREDFERLFHEDGA